MDKHLLLSSSIAVLGAGRSGLAAVKLLMDQGAVDVRLGDSRIPANAADIPDGVKCFWGEQSEQAAAGARVVVKSPGIPRDAEILRRMQPEAMLISELELAYSFMSPHAKIIAITGTNGKTTTTSWITHVLQSAGMNAVAGGNIGDAWCNTVADPENQSANTIFVIECSSFQLEDLVDFRPDVAVLTNLSPDHMDRYNDDVALYYAAKENIARNMRPMDTLLINENDSASEGFARDAHCRRECFSWKESDGAFAQVREGRMLVDGKELGAVAELPLPGRHNLENALATAAASILIDADSTKIWAGLLTFTAVEHRLELCGTGVAGVRYYNDSKATNLDAAEKALAGFEEPIIWVAGGRDAHSDYGSIAELVKAKVKHLIVIGEARQLFEDAYGDLVAVSFSESMRAAVENASQIADAGDVILFSPACKSFDMYTNYEERGADFKACVKEVLART